MDLHHHIDDPNLDRDVEGGTLTPPPTPASTPAHSRSPAPRTRRRPLDFIGKTHSPLHASHLGGLRRRESSGSASRTREEGTSEVEDDAEGETVIPKERSGKGIGDRLFRRQVFLKRERRRRRRKDREREEALRRSVIDKIKKSYFNPGLVLENSGSVARDHLATERTYLAYVRTSLALASMGVALTQLFTIGDLTSRATGVEISPATRNAARFARPLGGVTIAMAFATLLQGLWRFFYIQFHLPTGFFPMARMSAAFTGFGLTAVIVTIFGAILSGRTHD
ncbi:hypothetical protein CC1G_15076 [Coprinopsis cinerea okayama7|uniref:DUF202 domain-containing protein n=1 Tax=Coprinopsis cinerea (strain Okayama-7 / 130 / ATCC MYA-4618 / FGSC 9003) TaxID=240176 RepID=D6RP90_COPC7|nr:hypothetical protein CC1G_15076 [Coprinopsis cinerea okayama7\|eukprot:XP_002910742.1 hypothetical protein CC1G_15076 [Coprinopsis cinerea okayama7\